MSATNRKDLKGHYLQKQSGGFTDVDKKSARIKGYLNVMEYIDSSRDVISATAWDKTVKEMGPQGANRLRYVLQHDITSPIAKFTELYTADNKLHFVVDVSERLQSVGYIQDTMTLIEEGVLDENSVGFQVMRGHYEEEKETYRMTECKLFEGSVVTLADNDMSVITSMQYDESNYDPDKVKSQIDAMIKVVKRGNLTDEGLLNLEAKLRKLKTDIALTPQHEPAPEPHEQTEHIQFLKNLGDKLCQI